MALARNLWEFQRFRGQAETQKGCQLLPKKVPGVSRTVKEHAQAKKVAHQTMCSYINMPSPRSSEGIQVRQRRTEGIASRRLRIYDRLPATAIRERGELPR